MAKAADRRLWTGPPGSAWIDRAIEEAAAPTTWIAPTMLARDRLSRRLAILRARSGESSALDRTWCWDDLWRAVRSDQTSGPSCLSLAGARAALRVAIDRARQGGELTISAEVADSSGFRRRAARQIARWTIDGREPDDSPTLDSEVEAELWRIYRHYRGVLRRLKAVDEHGLAVWASSRIAVARRLPSIWGRVDRLVVIEPPERHPPVLRVLEVVRHQVKSLCVALPFENDPDRAELYAPTARLRDRLGRWGFVEETFSPPDHRPEGIAALSDTLFRDGTRRWGTLDRVEGLAMRGAPRGEGQARVVADWIRGYRDRGASPEDLLVVVRSWDEQAEVTVEALRSWGVPIETGTPRRLGADAAVQALRLAMKIPVNDWDTEPLGRLLRNGRLRPSWPEAQTPMALAMTAAVLREARVYRGRQAIETALDRMRWNESPDTEEGSKPDYLRRQRLRQSRLARTARPVFDRLSALIDAVARPGPWSEQVDRLARLAGLSEAGSTVQVSGLGLASDDDEALGHLFEALDDHGGVLEGIGQGDRTWSWNDFVAEVESIIADVPSPPAQVPEGAVRIATVEEAAGVSARHVLLANLAEGTFPDRAVIGPAAVEEDGGEIEEDSPRDDDMTALLDSPIEPGESRETDRRSTRGARQLRLSFGETPPRTPTPARPSPFGREMARFLRVVASAGKTLTLAYPTTDEKGVDLLAAGFLEEVRSLLTSRAEASITVNNSRLDPALLETTPQSDSERRVKAVARAVLRNDSSLLGAVARSPRQRDALRGTMAALLLGQRRGRDFSRPGRFEGLLRDQSAIASLADEFGPEYRFSASQLESLAFCPFQFFLRYVLRLEPIEERDELEEDRTTGGSRMHEALENLHVNLRDNPPGEDVAITDAVVDQVEGVIRNLLDREADPASPVGLGLRRIEAERMVRAGRKYAEQFAQYAASHGRDARTFALEYIFGGDGPESGPPLVLGEGPNQMTLQGMIDRIDVIDHPDGTLFRIIDYKTGPSPSKKKLTKGLALQLPLYAMAVERGMPAVTRPEPIDVGYWALRDKGYTPLVKMAEFRNGSIVPRSSWEPGPDRIVAFVLDLVDRLRRGMFPVHPAESDCERTCDYRSVCRIHQSRLAAKTWPEAPSMDREEDGS